MQRIGRLIATALLIAAAASSATAARIVVGKPAPDFRAVTFDGQKVSLADFKGQVLIVNFWATWCAPCRHELPLLDAYLRFQQSHGLRILAVTDENSVPSSRLKPLAKMVAFQMAWRFSGPYDNPSAFPTNYVIDRHGVIRYAQAGAFDLDTLNTVLVPLLKEPDDSALGGQGPAETAQ